MRAYRELVGCGCYYWVKGAVDEVSGSDGDSFDQSCGGRWMALSVASLVRKRGTNRGFLGSLLDGSRRLLSEVMC